jgi:hypothetical protein
MSDSRDRIEAAPADGRIRTYTDESGMSWRVFEQPFSEYDRRTGSSLIFASELAVRRVRDYPNDWFTLSKAALERLSWGV